MAPASLEFKTVTKRYGAVTAVDRISFRVEASTLTTLLGPSGCGKTTTLRMIAGLELATSGVITIGERDVTHLSAAERDVTMVFQSYALFPHMSVIDNAMFGPRASGFPRAKAESMARAKLELLGLKGLENRLPSELSGGQQQRVAVARALVLEPSLLLFDEPLSNLDARLRRKVREDIRALQKDLGLTVVYVTHDQEEALAVSDLVIVMSNAQIAQVARPRDLYEQPQSLFVADFIGDSNIVEGRVVLIEDGMATIQLGPAQATLPARGALAGPVKVSLRPDAVEIMTAAASGTLPGRIAKSSYLGKHVEYTVESELGPLFIVEAPASRQLDQGELVWLKLRRHGIAIVPQGD
jgi:iron(III) transport system ATP-binding protein